jgi:hypothetical protein
VKLKSRKKLTTWANIIKNYIDEVTDVGNPAVKAAKTTQYAKSKFDINTWALTLKVKTPDTFAVESKTREPVPSITTLKSRLLRRTRL